MVFKIRDKNLFWTRGGWKNNWHPKIFNVPKPTNAEYTMALRSRTDHHSFLRVIQSYRNISRTCKQYFYGDKRLEEIFIMELRAQFLVPILSECLTDQIKHGGERRFADQADRDYELVSYNQHPTQLYAYRLQNKYLQTKNEEAETVAAGEKTIYQTAEIEVQKRLAEESKKCAPGERLSLEKVTEVVLQVARHIRDAQGREAGGRGADGEFSDYLEQRRPYMAPDHNKVSY